MSEGPFHEQVEDPLTGETLEVTSDSPEGLEKEAEKVLADRYPLVPGTA